MTWLFHDLTHAYSRHTVLAKLLCQLWIQLVIEKCFNQSLCVRCFNNIHSAFFYDLTSEESRHSVLAHLLCWFGVLLVIAKWFNHTHCVRYFTQIHLGCFTIRPAKKSYLMCYVIHCVNLGYIWSVKSALSRHTVLDI